MDNFVIKLKNHIVFSTFAFILGAVSAVVVCLFFLTMNFGINFVWNFIPSFFNIPLYTILVCTFGGLIIGLFQKATNNQYPESLNTVLTKVSKDHWVPYDKIWVIFIAAVLPLIFGGCIGPEAGLTGAIAGLCSWIGDRFKYAAVKTKDLAKIGVSATLGVVFGAAPLFGIISNVEMIDFKERVNKKSKIIVYCFGVIGALFAYILINMILPAGMELPRFESHYNTSAIDILWMVLLALIGGIAGIFYHLSSKAVAVLMGLFKNAVVLKAVFGGLILGVVGTFLPFTMFSGETQMTELSKIWMDIGWEVLLITGIVKIIIGQICIQSGFKGGNIFPVIFSGVSIGFAASFFIPIDPMICTAVVTAAICAQVMKKPLMVVFLLFLCFPVNSAVQLLTGAVIGYILPTPKKCLND